MRTAICRSMIPPYRKANIASGLKVNTMPMMYGKSSENRSHLPTCQNEAIPWETLGNKHLGNDQKAVINSTTQTYPFIKERADLSWRRNSALTFSIYTVWRSHLWHSPLEVTTHSIGSTKNRQGLSTATETVLTMEKRIVTGENLFFQMCFLCDKSGQNIIGTSLKEHKLPLRWKSGGSHRRERNTWQTSLPISLSINTTCIRVCITFVQNLRVCQPRKAQRETAMHTFVAQENSGSAGEVGPTC